MEEIQREVEGIPHMSMSVPQATEMTAFILEHRPERILELGFRHGVSTCCMAGALDKLGRGTNETIDLINAQWAEPNIEALLERLGLRGFVTVHYEPTSYLWRLMKMLEENPRAQVRLLVTIQDHLPRHDLGL